jgi:hypothetical protein
LTMHTKKLYPIDYSSSNLAIACRARPLAAKQPLPALLLRNSDVRRIAVCRYQPANTGMRPIAVVHGPIRNDFNVQESRSPRWVAEGSTAAVATLRGNLVLAWFNGSESSSSGAASGLIQVRRGLCLSLETERCG